MWLYIRLTCISILFGLSYLFVPIYDVYCQVTGFGGNLRKYEQPISEIRRTNKSIGIDFERSYNAGVRNRIGSNVYSVIDSVRSGDLTLRELNNNESKNVNILFKPLIKNITTIIGKPTLAFYLRENLTNETIEGIRTYNVTPRKAAPYFHKLECFCFDEQRIKPFETIEMPVLFYIDPEIAAEIDIISINYTFFIIKS